MDWQAGIRIETGDLDALDVRTLIGAHHAETRGMAPPGSSHSLDIDALRQPRISLWVLRVEEALAGCAALLELDGAHAEIKSMRTAAEFRRRGVARRLLQHLIGEARSRGYARLSLDTGSGEYFAAARALYRNAGFVDCGPFANYREDPYKVFMTLEL